MKIKVELGGGLELLFDKKKDFEIEINKNQCIIKDVIISMLNKIKGNSNLFASQDGIIKPGIIVLYNDADWEIYEKEETKVEDKDTISFISTLHGG
jgi:ubiquitin related modifier 1